MANQAKNDQIANESLIINALQEHLPKATLHLNGKTYKSGDVVDFFKQHLAAIKKSRTARAALAQAVAEEREIRARVKALTPAIAAYVTTMFGPGSDVFNAFGLTQRKVGKKSAQTKANAVEKLRATRAARHTMGKNEKEAIHGATDDGSSVPNDNANGAAPAPSAPSSNGSTH